MQVICSVSIRTSAAGEILVPGFKLMQNETYIGVVLVIGTGRLLLGYAMFLPFGMLSAKMINPSLLTESIIITVVLCYFLHRIVVDFSTK